MKRYNHAIINGYSQLVGADDGKLVLYETAQAEVAALKATRECAAHFYFGKPCDFEAANRAKKAEARLIKVRELCETAWPGTAAELQSALGEPPTRGLPE